MWMVHPSWWMRVWCRRQRRTRLAGLCNWAVPRCCALARAETQAMTGEAEDSQRDRPASGVLLWFRRSLAARRPAPGWQIARDGIFFGISWDGLAEAAASLLVRGFRKQPSGVGQEVANVRGTDKSGAMRYQLNGRHPKASPVRPRANGTGAHAQQRAVLTEAHHGALSKEPFGAQWLCHTADRSSVWLCCTAIRESVLWLSGAAGIFAAWPNTPPINRTSGRQPNSRLIRHHRNTRR